MHKKFLACFAIRVLFWICCSCASEPCFSQNSIPSPEEIISATDNCGLNVLDVAYLALYPGSPTSAFPRKQVLEQYEATHPFSMAELQAVLPQHGIICHAYKLEELTDLSQLLDADRVAILYEDRGRYGHFFVCRLSENRKIELLDFPRAPITVDLDSESMKERKVRLIALVCERLPESDRNKIEACRKSSVSQDSPLSEPSELFGPSEDRGVTEKGGYIYEAETIAYPSLDEPGNLIASIRIKAVNRNQKFRIADVKGACSCFKSFVATNSSKSNLEQTVTAIFDRFRFNPISGADLILSVQSIDRSSEVLLRTKVNSEYAGTIGMPFVLPDVIRTSKSSISALFPTLSLYIPEKIFLGVENGRLTAKDNDMNNIDLNIMKLSKVKIAGVEYSKLLVRCELKDLTLSSSSAITILYNDLEFRIPFQERPSLW